MRLIIRPSIASTPRANSLAISEATSGVGWITASLDRQDVEHRIDQKPDDLVARC